MTLHDVGGTVDTSRGHCFTSGEQGCLLYRISLPLPAEVATPPQPVSITALPS